MKIMFKILNVIKLCFSSITLLLLIKDSLSECPSDYYSSGTDRHRCYSFVVGEQQWANAGRHCLKANGWIVTIDSEAKKEDVVRFVTSVRPPIVEKVWIGLITTKSEWKWLNGGLIQAQGCFLVDDGGMDSAPFNYSSGRRSSSYTPTTCVAECLTNGSLYSGLVRVTSDEMECRCANIFKPNISAVVPCTWKCPSDESQYCGANWEEDKEVKDAVLVFRNKDGVNSQLNVWARGQPNNLYPYYDPYQSCLTMVNSTDTKDLRWADENCAENVYDTDHRPYSHLCEYSLDLQDTTAEAACSKLSGFLVTISSGGSVKYRCYAKFYQSALSWFSARNDCQNRSGELLSVDVEEVYVSLTNTLSAHADDQMTRWWIGGRNERWSWVDGGGEAVYTYWGHERPQDGDSECIVMDYNSTPTRWRWVEEHCDTPHAFLCETLDSSFSAESSSTAQAASSTSALSASSFPLVSSSLGTGMQSSGNTPIPGSVQFQPSSAVTQSSQGQPVSGMVLETFGSNSIPSSTSAAPSGISVNDTASSSAQPPPLLSVSTSSSSAGGMVSPGSSSTTTPSLSSNLYSTLWSSKISSSPLGVPVKSSSGSDSVTDSIVSLDDSSPSNFTSQPEYSTLPMITSEFDEFNENITEEAEPGAGYSSSKPLDPGVIISVAFVSVTMAVTAIRTIVACAAGKSDSADFF